MASDATSELMRGHLLTRMDSKKKPPFWNCGSYDIDGPNQETNYFNKRREESCQLLTNSLALSAVVNANAEGGDYDWDSLAEWISDKQANLGTFGNSINTVIVKRSLYEKKRKSLDNSNGNIKVTISCDTCTEKTINVTNQAEEIHIPVNQRTVKLKVQGKGKVTVTARIIANMRPRQKRQLPQSVYYPVNIIVNQIHSARNVIQTVCLNVSTPVIRTLEISHGTYTLFDPIESSLKFLNNSQTPINVAVSSVGIHFMIKNIVANKTICYELQLGESNKGRNSPSLASPVPIRATHDVQGLVGMVLISHPDAPKSTPKRKRVSITRSRFIREISDPDMSVDKICFDNGNCACAELTCDVQYNQCPYDDQTKLSKKLQQKGNFILRVRASNITNETYNNVEYSIITCKITDYKPQSAKEKLPDNLNQDIRIWVRSCNEYTRNNTVYMIMGHEDGWTQNSKSNYNYIMNSNDRIEENTKKCGVLNSFITLSD
ncbi:unnamed protein product [Caenorhabditis angaria]|uniref:Uncharacterized protein n=1 Tax=Caenorhabditis angaria TaxID=860376 RepID=A0A9P1J2K9_9PELO|nr:unnamed protein product [Caenorhabditis angaria]